VLVPGFYFFIYRHYLLVEEQFSVYPKAIADELRGALYYGTYAATRYQDHERTLRHYRRALELCKELGLDPLSDEVLGIKVRIVEWLMNGAASPESAVATLESALGDCLRGVAEMDRELGRTADGEARARELDDKLGGDISDARMAAELMEEVLGVENGGPSADKKPSSDNTTATTTTTPQVAPPTPVPTSTPPTPENPWHRRRRLLHKAIQICLSLGWMFSDEHVLQPAKAQVAVSWAYEATVKELLRRRAEGVREGEGDWMKPDELGALLERECPGPRGLAAGPHTHTHTTDS
jgi:hypothetical protein